MKCGAAASAESIRSTSPRMVSQRVAWMVSGSSDSRRIASKLSLALTCTMPPPLGRHGRDGVGQEPQAGAEEDVHFGAAPHRRRDQHIAIDRRRRSAPRPAPSAPPRPCSRPSGSAWCADSGRAATEPSAARRLPSRWPPAHRPRSGVVPKPRWSGENTAMPAAARSGAGYSQASRLSFMPCSASTTARGAWSGIQTR